MNKWWWVAGVLALGQIGNQALSAATPAASADALVQEFVYQSLALSPVAASAAGYHVHDGARLDGIWDDFSAAGISKTRKFNRQVLQRVDGRSTPGSMPSGALISI